MQSVTKSDRGLSRSSATENSEAVKACCLLPSEVEEDYC
jgi:hypothetical protein